MVTRPKRIYACTACGAQHPKWLGRCPDCGAWNTLVEETSAPAPAPAAAQAARPVPLPDAPSLAEKRLMTGIAELDRALGGGFVPASSVLVGGDPGIGKSTLLLQAAATLARQGIPCLYWTAEESSEQVRMRAERIGALEKHIAILHAAPLEAGLAAMMERPWGLVVVDSIQTVFSERLTSAPGTVAQVRECANVLARAAKERGSALALVGHVTKEGAIAGPKVLEHLVDAVLLFEGDRGLAHRILRAVKNRFGAAGEIGVFEMGDAGLRGVDEVSRFFLAGRAGDASGVVALAAMEGTRALLVEVQALVAPTVYAQARRTAIGVDAMRLAMLAAVLERRLGLPLAQHDIYLNIAGGVRLVEPAADLAIALALASSLQDRVLDAGLCVFGEIGLAGEIRPVGQPEARVREAARLGFARVILPHGNLARVQRALAKDSLRDPPALAGVRTLAEALAAAWPD